MRSVVSAIVCGIVLALALMWALSPDVGHNLEPLVSASPSPETRTTLPPGTVLLHAKDAPRTTPPFAVHADSTAADGLALVLPEGAGSKEKTGRAAFDVDVQQPGRYTAWVRARWRDSCGNSVTLHVDDQPPHDAGQDAVYGTWHWVEGGQYDLSKGTHRIQLIEREDGVALDHVLLSPDEQFTPVGPIGPAGEGPALRRFADRFERSPGHGLAAWNVVSGQWEIEFSLDPNRIPNQYSLLGRPDGGEAVALIKSPPWNGCRLSFSVLPLRKGSFGAVLERSADGKRLLRVAFRMAENRSSLEISGVDGQRAADLAGHIEPKQWHRIDIERWAWVLRVRVDGREVFRALDLPPQEGHVALFVADGATVFDDVQVDEIPWLAEDGNAYRMSWQVEPGARWYRSPSTGLLGRGGTIATPPRGLPVRAVLVDSGCDGTTPYIVTAEEMPQERNGTGLRIVSSGNPSAALQAVANPARVRRFAVCYGQDLPDRFRIGPYHFTQTKIEDPSDYLDFTPEEYERIKGSSDAEKLRRKKKFNLLVAKKGEKRVWLSERGAWTVKDGVLTGARAGSALRYSQEVLSDLELRARVRLVQPKSAAAFVLHGNGSTGMRVCVGRSPSSPKKSLVLPAPKDTKWHDLSIRTVGGCVEAQLDAQEPQRTDMPRGDGGAVLLEVLSGSVQFDDIEFLVVRNGEGGAFYTFDRRETDWQREGGEWMDHGGISCVLASHWISLVAPKGEGMIWNKRPFEPDVQVAFDVEENTEWFGWDKKPSHVHHPFDNIRVVLSPGTDVNKGYRLEVNSRNRTATVLYRDGKEVASAPQDRRFPIRYRGKHAPYSPRKNRIVLIKRGGDVRALINGCEVLRFRDPNPIDVTRIGIGGYKTRINFSHIEVRKL